MSIVAELTQEQMVELRALLHELRGAGATEPQILLSYERYRLEHRRFASYTRFSFPTGVTP